MVTKEILGRELTSTDNVLIAATWDEPTEWISLIKKEHPGIVVNYFLITLEPIEVYMKGGSHVPDEYFKDVTIFVTMQYLPPPEVASKLEICTILSAGINHIANTPIYRDTDITITTSNGVHGPQISECFTGNPIRDLVTQKIGVFSYGSIGRQVGRVAHALGMEVHAYTAHPKPTRESRRDNGYIVPGTGDKEGEFPVKWWSGTGKASFHEFLREGFDVLVFSVPLTDDTRGLMGKKEFEILKETRKSPFLVNISRGPIVVTEELEKSLREGVENGGLRGAALDVVDPEPLPKEHTLWDAPNVYISPHISGAGVTYFERCLDIVAINLKLRAEGKGLINVVDRKRGY
ncbi:hypothetical protein TWF191_008505 [Orbilia oligospora]|uniref:D-isomer specific 2-hydroxyacid dehydrogenase NAD-binding domain-containing protein n=1 Tax=Orbilia oligospora TaxID=2813651 RepID=A0A7C8QKU8_ORBOL|nr:hypothetical protein TWF191_008505 [Orbilia oligospora]